MIGLVTRKGKRLRATVTPDYELGRVFFEVERFGTWTVEIQYAAMGAPEEGEPIHVRYGRWSFEHYPHRSLPEAPVVNGIELEGGAVFTEASMRGARYPGAWMACPWRAASPFGTTRVPEGTQAATADIVEALVDELLGRDDLDRLKLAVARRHAPGLAKTLDQDVERLRGEIAVREAEIAEKQTRRAAWQEVVDGGNPFVQDAPFPPPVP